jgi:alginate O-acetyltransferase complex protein AlgI
MPFNSIVFLFYFLPLVLAVFYLVPGKVKNLVLLFFSLLFYTWGDKVLVLVLLYSVFANFHCALLMEGGKRKLGLALSLIINLLFLGFFKYYNFTVSSVQDFLMFFNVNLTFLSSVAGLTVPLGISFYTFKIISYSLDVYHKKTKASTNIIEFATFVTMFPTLIAGPIVRYVDIQQQLSKKNISIANFACGIERFIIGLAKKMLIANTFAAVADSIFGTQVSDLSTTMAWVGVVAYTFQIYFDFSGYSDMAIGLAKMFGFDLLENFNYPYVAKNIGDFWRRWHISLSNWLRDYLFLPIAYSVSRKLKKESYASMRTDHIIYLIAIFITFLVCGIWHGAAMNFIAWGLWYAMFIAIEHVGFRKVLKRLWRPLQHLYTLMVIMLGWVIFRVASLSDAAHYFFKMFNFSPGDASVNSYLSFFTFTREFWFITLLAIIFSLPAYGFIRDKFKMQIMNKIHIKILIHYLRIVVLLILLIISVSYISSGTINAFIYAQF